MKKLKNNANVVNVDYFKDDNDMAEFEGYEDIKGEKVVRFARKRAQQQQSTAPAQLTSIVCRQKIPGILDGLDQKDSYIGDLAQSKCSVLTLSYPSSMATSQAGMKGRKSGIITSYAELRVAAEEHPVFAERGTA